MSAVGVNAPASSGQTRASRSREGPSGRIHAAITPIAPNAIPIGTPCGFANGMAPSNAPAITSSHCRRRSDRVASQQASVINHAATPMKHTEACSLEYWTKSQKEVKATKETSGKTASRATPSGANRRNRP
jgi:hypothetical protein